MNRYASALIALCLILSASVGAATLATAADDNDSYSNFVELRVYTTQPGKRDRFLEYFQEHYLESQEVFGMRIWGQFQDLETPTHFVWIRGYQTMESRKDGLMGFYMSPVWRETGDEVRAMLASAALNVHFLEPVSATDGFDENLRRPALVSEVPADHESGIIVAQIFDADTTPASEIATQLQDVVIRAFEARGAVSLGLFQTSDEPNNVPQLPFIEDQQVVVWFASFESRQSFDDAIAAVQPPLEPKQTLILKPGERSRLYHRPDDQG